MKMLFNKVVLAVCMAVLLGFGIVPMNVQASTGDVEILLNGKALVQNDEIGYAVIKDGRTMVPLRLVVEALGFTADWEMDGPNVITMRSGDKRVYHRVGTLEASDFSPLVQSAKVIATTDVPSYIASGRTMVGLRLISEAFGVGVEWKRNTTGGGQVILTTDAPKDDLIWLDSSNSVSRSQIVNRLSQHQVKDNRQLGQTTVTRTLGEQAKDYQPRADRINILSREALVQRAVGYMEGLYNVNYRTDTADKFAKHFSTYSADNTTGNAELWAEWGRNGFQLVVDQQLIMNSIFVTDETLVYELNASEAARDRTGESGTSVPYAVRGTLFYKFESNLGGGFWTNPGYEMGQWYWKDVEVRFRESFAAPGKTVTAVTEPNRVPVFNPDGTRAALGDDWIMQSLSRLPK